MAPEIVLLLDFDGTLYTGDLPIQSYARHLAAGLPDDGARALIAGMRQFLEARTIDGAPTTDLSAAEDGYQAVELLAAGAGLTQPTVDAAYRASRRDLAGSAFALDAAEGLLDLLTGWGERAHVVLVADADRSGVAEVLEAIGAGPYLHEVITDADKPGCWPELLPRLGGLVGDPARILAVGDRWSSDLAPIAATGGWTGLIDRFGRGDGSPDARAVDLAGLIPAIQHHADPLLARQHRTDRSRPDLI